MISVFDKYCFVLYGHRAYSKTILISYRMQTRSCNSVCVCDSTFDSTIWRAYSIFDVGQSPHFHKHMKRLSSYMRIWNLLKMLSNIPDASVFTGERYRTHTYILYVLVFRCDIYQIYLIYIMHKWRWICRRWDEGNEGRQWMRSLIIIFSSVLCFVI